MENYLKNQRAGIKTSPENLNDGIEVQEVNNFQSPNSMIRSPP